jgi:hypothetical protein
LEPPEVKEHHQAISHASKNIAKDERKVYKQQLKDYSEYSAALSPRSRALPLQDIVRPALEDAAPRVREDADPRSDALVLFGCTSCKKCDAGGHSQVWHPPMYPLQGMELVKHADGNSSKLALLPGSLAETTTLDGCIVPLRVDEHAEMLGTSNSRTHHVDKFQEIAHNVASDIGGLKGTVPYISPCPEVCSKSLLPVKVLEARILKYFATVVAGLDTKATVVGVHHLFFDAEFSNKTLGHQRSVTISLETAAQRSGPHLANQTFTIWDEMIVQALPRQLRILNPREHPHVQTLSKRDNAHQVDTLGRHRGAYAHLSERELTGFLLRTLLGLPHAELIQMDAHVTVSRLNVLPAKWQASWGVPEAHDMFVRDGVRSNVTFDLPVPGAEEETGDFLQNAMAAADDESVAMHGLEDYNQLAEWLEGIFVQEDGHEEEELQSQDDESDIVVPSDDEDSDGGADNPEEVDVVEDDPIQKVMTQLGVVAVDQEIFDESMNRHIGTLTTVIAGEVYIKLECKWHNDCRMFLNTRTRFVDKWIACLKHLHSGRNRSAKQHAEDIVVLKESFGIHPRRVRPATTAPTARGQN